MKVSFKLLLCTLPLCVSATEIPEKDWEYERLDDDHVMIHNADQSRRSAAIDLNTAGDITVPSSLRSMQVVSIGEKAFYNCSKLTSVTIPEGVTNIGDNAFRGCSSLTNVVFPTSLKSIGTYAFYNCSRLSSANFTGASLIIGTHAFRDCSRIANLTFSGDLISIGEYAYSGCEGLRDVTLLSKSVKVEKCAFSAYPNATYPWMIDSEACTALTNMLVQSADASFAIASFSGCTALRALTADVKSISIGERAFSRYYYYQNYSTDPCTALQDVRVDADTLSLESSSFASCSSLTNGVLIGSESATIGESAFSSCSKLRRIDLPEMLKVVSKTAFSHCTSLETIVFTTNLTQIAYQAFDTCTSLKSVGFQEGLQSIADQAFYGCGSITNLVFPQSLASVGARAFECCETLRGVIFSEGNTNQSAAATVEIGERAFYQCESLTNVVLSQCVSSLGSRAFSQCDSLASINLPTNFTELAESTFEDCSALSAVDLPVTLVSIGNTVFFGCTNLTVFLIPTQNVVSIGAKAFKNTKYWNEYPSDLVVNNGYILGFKNDPVDVTLPDGCKAIPVAMFEGMTTLKSVTIPDTVKEIGARAFNGCSGITNLSFDSVTTIGNSAFEGCSSLSSVSLSDVLTAIPGNCFKDCSSLKAVFIPDPVASIGEYAFYNCVSLVNVSGGGGVETVGSYAFAQCPKMQPFEFPNDVAYGEHVFQGCTWTEHVLFPSVGTLKDEYPQSYASIKSVVFSSDMTIITNEACAGCSSLASVRIPEGVNSIGSLAFNGCAALTSVVMSASVTSVSSNAFQGCASVRALTVSGQFPIASAFPDSYESMTTIGIAEEATSLTDSLFSNCVSLVSVDIPWRVTTIGARAFYGCVGLSNVVVPEYVTEIGELAFCKCTALRSVDYLCDIPKTDSTNIYASTCGSMLSKVLVQLTGWQTTTNSAGATILPSEWCDRPIVWWGTVQSKLAKVRFSDNSNYGGGVNQYYLANAGREILTLPDDPEHPYRTNAVFLGWYTAATGGEEIEEGQAVEGSVTYYAHWDDDEEEEEEEEEALIEYDFTRANKYVGSVLEGETVVGSVLISFAKGKTSKTTGETTASATAKVQLLGEGQLSMKGTLTEDGTAALTVSRSTREMDVEIDSDNADCLTGSIDGYEIVAYRDLFSSTALEDKTRANDFLKLVKGKYVAVLAADGETAFATGYAALSVNVGTKGTVKVSGVMPDGVSVSASAQLSVTEGDDGSDSACATIVAPMYSKKGGFAFQLIFDSTGAPALSGVSEWIADKTGTTVALSGEGVQAVAGLEEGEHAFAADISSLSIEGVDIETGLTPDGTAFFATAKKWTLPKADTVKFIKDEGYVIKKDNGNPAALKLTYNSGTGLFSGSFKVYGVTSAGRSKTYTATVKGGVLGGVGYGTAVVKKIGSLPVAAE